MILILWRRSSWVLPLAASNGSFHSLFAGYLKDSESIGGKLRSSSLDFKGGGGWHHGVDMEDDTFDPDPWWLAF